jgi:N-dimethylarginine dimethylaminohydrolase
MDTVLAEIGCQVTAIDIDRFANWGGGLLCLTMPLA